MGKQYSPPELLTESGSHALGLGIIGCGRVVERFHLPALLQSMRWKIIWACDTSRDRRAWAKSLLPDQTIIASPDEAIGHDEVAAVLIATPPSTHAELALKALDNQLHVLLEKPGGKSKDDANRIKSAVETSGRILWVGFNRRFRRSYMTLRQVLQAHSQKTALSIRSELGFPVKEWDAIAGGNGHGHEGGALFDVASHQLDLLPWLWSRAITRLRTRTYGARGIEYELEFVGGVKAQCAASHSDRYSEILDVLLKSQHLYVHPTGLVEGGKLTSRVLRKHARIRNWIDRKLIRLGILSDELTGSYGDQWDAFWAAIHGQSASAMGATADSLLAVHAAMDAILRSRDAGGRWITVA